MYKLIADTVVALLLSVTVIIALNLAQLTSATDDHDECAHLLKQNHVFNTTNNNLQLIKTDINYNNNNKKTKLTNELYKLYTDCLRKRHEKQPGKSKLVKSKKASSEVLDEGMRFKRERRSVLDGEGMRFKKDPILDEEGMRFKKGSVLDDEGARFKKASVLDDEGARFKKASVLDNEGMRFRKSVLDGEGMRFRKSMLDGEGARFKKASVLDDEGARFKKASVLDDEGARFKKGSLLDDEGARFKKASVLDDEGARFKKASVLDDEGARFRKSVLDGEGMRFKKLMAQQLARLRNLRNRYRKIEDNASDEKRDGGSSSDILEGEGMRFKKSPSYTSHSTFHPDHYYHEANNLADILNRIKSIYVIYRD